MQKKSAVDIIYSMLKKNGYKVVKEYKFLKNRKFRFDIAIPDIMVAIEYEGGIYQRGRHVSPAGYNRDCEKYNLAQINGWKVLRYTTEIKKIKNWQYIPLLHIQEITKECQNDNKFPRNKSAS